MLLLLLVQCCLLALTFQSELEDILLETDRFFQTLGAIHDDEDILEKTEGFKLMLRRSYGLGSDAESLVRKRSLDGKSTLLRDKQGIYFIKNISEVAAVPAKFPNDLQIISASDETFYVAALESNENSLQSQLADNLVLYETTARGSTKEIARVILLGGYRLASYTFRNVTYLLASEFNADIRRPFEGSSLYIMNNFKGGISLEKIQILNITHPKDLKFWEHQEQMYLAVSTGSTGNSIKSYALIYRWLGHNFDFIQKIEVSNANCVTPFIIGSSMFLAVAGHEDTNGNAPVESNIFRFQLQTGKFSLYQKIKTHATNDIAYFSFRDSESQYEEHFLAAANIFETGRQKIRNYKTDSIIYKFDGKYFVPFQSFKLTGMRQWIPIKGSKNEFLLLAVCSFAVVGYQYNGWRFAEVNLDFGQPNFGKNIMSIRPYIYNKNIYLAVADKNNAGNDANLWEIKFENENLLEKRYSEVENWCKIMLTKTADDTLDAMLKEASSSLNGNFNDMSSKENLNISRSEMEASSSESSDSLNISFADDLIRLNKDLKKYEKTLQEYKEKVENAEDIVIDVTDLTEIPNLEVNCSGERCCSFENAHIVNLNSKDFVWFLNNAVTLNEDMVESFLEFENVRIVHDLSPTHINGHPTETIIDTVSDIFLNSELIINGSMIIEGDLYLKDIYLKELGSKESTLHQDGAQNFTGDLILEKAVVKNLEIAGKLNGVELRKIIQKPAFKLQDAYDKLNINYLYVNGTINGLDFSSMDAYGRSENENFGNESSDEYVNVMNVDELIVKSGLISGIEISNIVRTTAGTFYKIKGDFNFTQDVLEVNYLEVKKSLNDIQLNKISNESHATIRDTSDVIVIEGRAFLQDITDPDGKYSLLDIIQNGLLLNETVLPSRFRFSSVKVDNFAVGSINDVPLKSWVLRNSDEVQNVKGKKKFLNNVNIDKDITIKWINGMDMVDLYNDTLFIDGDQVITGDVAFNKISAARLNASYVSIGGEELLLKPKKLVIYGSVDLEKLSAINATVNGFIDGLSWSEIVSDSVLGRDDLITGEKIVNGTLKVRHLNFNGTLNAASLQELSGDDRGESKFVDVSISSGVSLNFSLSVDDLTFEGSLDSIDKSRFGQAWLLSEGDQTIAAPMIFTNVELKSGAALVNETINRINLRNMFENSIKINESVHIKHLLVFNSVKAKKIDLSGTLNKADFGDSVILSESSAPQTVAGEWLLNKNLVVNGSLLIDGLISGTNASHFCSMGRSFPQEINLVVLGSVAFDREPEILVDLNGVNVRDVARNVWFTNENVTLTGGVKKFCNVELHSDAGLKGELNGLDLSELPKRYFSRTSSKFATKNITVKNLVIRKFSKINDMKVGGKVNGVDLVKWSKGVLLQDVDQVIRGSYYFNELSTENLILNGTVNDLDLAEGVLRYDVENAVVAGEKTFLSLVVRDLEVDKGGKVQGVSVDEWARRAVRKEGNFTVSGSLTLHDPIFTKGLQITGLVNGLQFDANHILTVKGNQTITGKKIFNPVNYPNETFKMKNLEAKGLVSGIDLGYMFENQAYKDSDLVFTAPQTFAGVLTGDHLRVKGSFQRVNVSDLCRRMSKPFEIQDFSDRYRSLLQEAKDINDHLTERPFFLDHYEAVQTVKGDVVAVLPFSIGSDSLMALITRNEMKFMEWDPFSERFVHHDNEVLTLVQNVTFATSGSAASESYLYLEMSNSSKIFSGGRLTDIEAAETSCVVRFDVKHLNKSCFFVGRKWGKSKIACNDSATGDLRTYQNLSTLGSVRASVLHVNDDVYIAAINKEKVVDRTENILTVYKFDKKFNNFTVRSSLPEINPVSVATISYKKRQQFLALAGGHLPESVDSSVISIFRLSREHDAFIRHQSLLVDIPVDVHFARLPTTELVLYVLSMNPTKPFVVYLYRGAEGFVEATSGPSLYVGSSIHSSTDASGQHFVFISGYGRGQILRAGFKGNKMSSENGSGNSTRDVV